MRSSSCCRSAFLSADAVVCTATRPPHLAATELGAPLPRLHRDWAHPIHICAVTGVHLFHGCTGTGLTDATAAPGLSPHAHLCRNSAPSATSAPGLSPSARLCSGTRPAPAHICTGTEPNLQLGGEVRAGLLLLGKHLGEQADLAVARTEVRLRARQAHRLRRPSPRWAFPVRQPRRLESAQRARKAMLRLRFAPPRARWPA